MPPFINIIQFGKQCTSIQNPHAHPLVSAQTPLHQRRLLWTQRAEASLTFDSIIVDFSTTLLMTNLGSVLFNAANPVTGTMPGTFQEFTKCLLTKLMKRGSQRSYKTKGP